jgi:DNA-binding MarR family transcriptional regulator
MTLVNPPISATARSTRERPHIGVLLERARRRVLNNVVDRFQREGFTDIRWAHGSVFVFLPEDGIRLTDLAQRARMTKQSMGELVRDLEDLGYVERQTDPDDARARIITFTERGRIANEIGIDEILATEAEWASEVGEERVRALRETLELLTHTPVQQSSLEGETA